MKKILIIILCLTTSACASYIFRLNSSDEIVMPDYSQTDIWGEPNGSPPIIIADPPLYVDQANPAASNYNTGDEEHPWKTIAFALAHIEPGDHLYIKGAVDPEDGNSVYLHDNSNEHGLDLITAGTAENPIVIEGYPGHTVIIDGGYTGYAIKMDKASYTTIKGIDFRKYSRFAESSNTTVDLGVTDVTIEDCNFCDATTTGFRFRYIHGDLNITDCNVSYGYDSNLSFRSCENIYCTRVVSKYSVGTGDGDGFVTAYCAKSIFIDCEAYGNGEDGFDLTSDLAVMINCKVHDHEGDSCNVKNWCRSGDGYAPKLLIIINCLIANAGEDGIKSSDGCTTYVYNSVIANNTDNGIRWADPAPITDPVQAYVENCIIMNNGGYGVNVYNTSVNVVDCNNNLFYGNALGLTDDTHSNTNYLTDEPNLVSSGYMYALKSDSDCIDAGDVNDIVTATFLTYLSSASALDYDSVVRPQGSNWDIGMYERRDSNNPPVFVNVPDVNELDCNEAETIQFTFTASDPDGDEIVYYLHSGDIDSGMTIDASTGVFTWVTNYFDANIVDVNIGVTDIYYSEPYAVETVRIDVNNVNQAPTYDGLTTYTCIENRAWWIALQTSDIDGDALTYSMINLPDGLTFDDVNCFVYGTPTNVDTNVATLTINDGTEETVQDINIITLSETTLYTAPVDEDYIFYVDDVNGNDANDGSTEEEAWKTIQHAESLLTAGQMVLIRDGTYTFTVMNYMSSGTEGNPIIYKAYTGESPVISGVSVSAFSGGNYLVLDGLTFTSGNSLWYSPGNWGIVTNCTAHDCSRLLANTSHNYMRIENCTAETLSVDFIEAGSGGGSNYHFYNCDVNSVTNRGVYSYGDNVTVTDCTIANVGSGGGIRCYGGSMYIEGCTVTDNTLGLYIRAGSVVKKENSTITGNITNVDNDGTYIDAD